MDIAFALLLADRQWGSTGTVNYLAAAGNIIGAIMDNEINQTQWTIRLGDWANSGSYNTATRPSDFMLGHLKAFKTASGDARWGNVTDKTYSIINSLYTGYSASTGLLPDFVIYSGGAYKPAAAGFLEDTNDGNYNYNSCRTPWRIATDYLITGDNRAISQLTQLNSWIKTKVSSSPGSIKDGYKLNGTTFGSYNSGAFTPPSASVR